MSLPRGDDGDALSRSGTGLAARLAEKMVSVEEFARVLGLRVTAAADDDDGVGVDDVGVAEFERMGYGVVVLDVAVAIAGDGRDGSDLVSVFRVRKDRHARVQWWVVGIWEREVIGLMAEGVES